MEELHNISVSICSYHSCRCLSRCEDCARKDCNFDVDQDCMEKHAGVEPTEEVAKRLVAATQLKMEFARKLLDQYAWDYEAALENFLEMKEAGNLPPHLFNDA